MKLIERTDYMNEIKELSGTPDIKVITGVRRCGKSKLMDAFVQYIKPELFMHIGNCICKWLCMIKQLQS